LKPTRAKLIAAGALLAAGAAIAPTGPAVAAHVAANSSVKLVQTNKGKLVATGRGFTLYMFTHDKSGKDTCQSISMCTGIWPPYTISGKPIAGPGINAAKLATIKLANGKRQVTYYGHPLYRYAFDGGPAETSYIGAVQFGGTWEGTSATGKAVK
jgi:predicted lipoprotein with Yx(FWY)xxD motif